MLSLFHQEGEKPLGRGDCPQLCQIDLFNEEKEEEKYGGTMGSLCPIV